LQTLQALAAQSSEAALQQALSSANPLIRQMAAMELSRRRQG
jgi:hypothetical protein